MASKTKTDQDREVTMSGALKFMLVVFAFMATMAIIFQTWPVSGIVLVVLLCAALAYFRKRS